MALLDFISKFKYKKNSLETAGLCGLQLHPEGLAAAYIRTNNAKTDRPVVNYCDFIKSDVSSLQKMMLALSPLVKAHKLDKMPCVWILAPDDYALLPIGILPVAQHEILPAIRFQIKNRIDFSIEQAVITYFTVPHVHESVLEEFVYAVVAKKDFLQKTAQAIRDSGLNLKCIDIPEFALRNIVACVYATENASEKNSIALLDFTASKAVLMIMQKGVIQIIRQIDFKKNHSFLENTDNLYSEIQRSLDYYENELGLPAISQFCLSPSPFVIDILPELKEQLNCKVETIELGKFFGFSDNLEKEKNFQCFSAIGGALRNEHYHATAD